MVSDAIIQMALLTKQSSLIPFFDSLLLLFIF